MLCTIDSMQGTYEEFSINFARRRNKGVFGSQDDSTLCRIFNFQKYSNGGLRLTILHDTGVSRLPCPALTADERKGLDDFN